MIPKNINKEHILRAINQADETGIPKRRQSTRFLLTYNGKIYPPKYILSLANEFANGEELDPESYSGGKESNSYLNNLGFRTIIKANLKRDLEVINDQSKPPRKTKAGKIKPKVTKEKHTENCQECKANIKRLLEMVYGEVIVNYKVRGVSMVNFVTDSSLRIIYKELTNHRGFLHFVKAKSLPNCDFYLPSQKQIVEIDESQHFTKPRLITLEKYPKDVNLDFDKSRWMDLCRQKDRKDNSPPHRDEQRAWYDTMRDYLPRLAGFKPTIRLLAEEVKWCGLDPDDPKDIKRFKQYLHIDSMSKSKPYSIPSSGNYKIGRIVLTKEWPGDLEEAKEVLIKTIHRWPDKTRVDVLMTCGGFVQFPWPNITRDQIGDNKNPNQHTVDQLFRSAETYVEKLLKRKIRKQLTQRTRYLTIGIDSFKEKVSISQANIPELHVELVCVFDLHTGSQYWTGKSYPTTGQQEGLVRIVDLQSHFFDLEGIGKTMVLGCHDLASFNNRNWNNTGPWRKNLKLNFREFAAKENPVMILHHPHTTVKIKTWLASWNMLERLIPSVENYCGSGRFYESNRDVRDFDQIDSVLDGTKKGKSLDLTL